MSDRTTTVEIKTETWAALDRRKERGDSFDDVIKRLIDATPVGFGELKKKAPDVIYDDVEPISDDLDYDPGCAQFDVIDGGPCGGEATHKQDYKYPDEDEWSTFYYCDKHRPDTVAELADQE